MQSSAVTNNVNISIVLIANAYKTTRIIAQIARSTTAREWE